MMQKLLRLKIKYLVLLVYLKHINHGTKFTETENKKILEISFKK